MTDTIPIHAEPGAIVIGPAALPGEPGCPSCATRRQAANDTTLPDRAELPDWASTPVTVADALHANPFVADLVTDLVTAERAALTAGRPARTDRAQLRIALETGEISHHRILPDPHCPDCGSLPADGPQRVTAGLGPAPKTDRTGLRTRTLTATEVEERYSDPKSGLVAQLRMVTRPALVGAVASYSPALQRDTAFGRAFSLPGARLTAMLEALERLGGLAPRGARSHVRARYRDLDEPALDPRDLGTHHATDYRSPGFPFRPFSPDRETDWVWGYSFGRGEPLLVPETIAYYGPGRQADRTVFETSNGCALGGCLSEAVLHGLLEVAERDAFLMTWYARLPATEVALDSAADRRIPLLAEHTRDRLGYRLRAFTTTLEQGIPSFWVLAESLAPSDGRPAALSGAGAHPHPEHALLRGLSELTGLLAVLDGPHDRAAAERLLADPGQVRTMDDHSLLYGHPDAHERLDFLTRGGPPRPLAELFTDSWPEYDDIEDDLTELVHRYLATGLDVIFVDQTSPEHQEGGLACAKVIVPGTVPMTFGHRFRRLEGLPRLRTVPRLLGHPAQASLNPHPHPFP